MDETTEVTDEQIEAYMRRKTAEMQVEKEATRIRNKSAAAREKGVGGIFGEMWTFWQDALLRLTDPKGKTKHARLIEVANTDEGRMAELAVVASTDAAMRDVVGIEHMAWPPTDGTKIRVLRSA
jgi:hypothetical protein